MALKCPKYSDSVPPAPLVTRRSDGDVAAGAATSAGAASVDDGESRVAPPPTKKKLPPLPPVPPGCVGGELVGDTVLTSSCRSISACCRSGAARLTTRHRCAGASGCRVVLRLTRRSHCVSVVRTGSLVRGASDNAVGGDGTSSLQRDAERRVTVSDAGESSEAKLQVRCFVDVAATSSLDSVVVNRSPSQPRSSRIATPCARCSPPVRLVTLHHACLCVIGLSAQRAKIPRCSIAARSARQ